MKKILLINTLIIVILLTGCTPKSPPGAVYPNLSINNNTLIYDGELNVDNIRLNEPVYEDLRFPASAINIKGSSDIPEETNLGYGFDANSTEQLFIIAQMPHSRVSGSDITAHWHWHTDDNTPGNVTWCIEYRWGNINEVFDAAKTHCITDSSQLNEEIHLMTPELHLDGTNKTSSSILRARIYRDATNANDTYPHDAQLLEFDIYYLLDKLGEDI